MSKSLKQVLSSVDKEEPRYQLDESQFKFTPTEEQREIIQTAIGSPKVLSVEAGAGTGKTSTLELLAVALPGRGQYTAFNRALVEESSEKFRGTRVACNTTHSLGFRAVGHRYSHRLNSPRKKATEIAAILGIEDINIKVAGKDKRLPGPFLATRVMMALRRFCQSDDRKITERHFRYIDGIDMPEEDANGNAIRTSKNNRKVNKGLVKFAEKAWKDLTSEDGQLPYFPDVYVKQWQLGNPVISADYILLDEAQDTAPVMLDILSRQTAPLILVGDSAQQIYDWRGAVNAMREFEDAPRCFLSQSFRFGQAIADVANKVLETLEEGTELRLRGLESIDSSIGPVETPSAILCRTNAMAVAYLLSSIADGLHPFLVGGGSDIIAFVSAVIDLQEGRSTSHPELACFDSWNEVVEYSQMDEGEDLKLMVKLITQFGAKEILAALNAMPEEKDADLVISTAHKSKGRQWPSVKLTSDFPTNVDAGDSDRRLLYVAVTRAQLQLDITDCPFFTGEGKLDVTDIARNYSAGDAEKLPQTEVKQPKPRPTPKDLPEEEFTWTRFNGSRPTSDWMVRGPANFEGRIVEVCRKDGSTSKKKLRQPIWTDGTNSIYEV